MGNFAWVDSRFNCPKVAGFESPNQTLFDDGLGGSKMPCVKEREGGRVVPDAAWAGAMFEFEDAVSGGSGPPAIRNAKRGRVVSDAAWLGRCSSSKMPYPEDPAHLR